MSRFSTNLPIEEIHFNGDLYTILFKSEKIEKDNNFTFNYNEDIDIGKFSDNIEINQIEIIAKYIRVNKNKIIFKDENLKPIASFRIEQGKIFTIRKYKHKQYYSLRLSAIGFESYWYLLQNNEDKIKNK